MMSRCLSNPGPHSSVPKLLVSSRPWRSLLAVALRWLVQQGIPVIPKSSNPEHLAQNIDLFDWELTRAEMKELTAAKTPAVAGGNPGTSGDCSIN